MLELLPEWLRERVSEYLDRIIHASMALTVAFTGMSLEDLMMIVPALVSVAISILAYVAKHQDRKRKMEIYQREEEKRTAAMLGYLDGIKEESASAAVLANRTIKKASQLGNGIGEEDGQC